MNYKKILTIVGLGFALSANLYSPSAHADWYRIKPTPCHHEYRHDYRYNCYERRVPVYKYYRHEDGYGRRHETRHEIRHNHHNPRHH